MKRAQLSCSKKAEHYAFLLGLTRRVGRSLKLPIVTACAVRAFCKTSRPLGLRRLSPFCAFPALCYNDKRAVIVPRPFSPCRSCGLGLPAFSGLGASDSLPPDDSRAAWRRRSGAELFSAAATQTYSFIVFVRTLGSSRSRWFGSFRSCLCCRLQNTTKNAATIEDSGGKFSDLY